MEENRYPIIDEEETVGMACDPAAVTIVVNPKSINGVTEVHDWIDDLDWDKFPSLGPSSEEEAVARIDRFEQRLVKDEVNWTSSEEFDKQLYEEFPWLK